MFEVCWWYWLLKKSLGILAAEGDWLDKCWRDSSIGHLLWMFIECKFVMDECWWCCFAIHHYFSCFGSFSCLERLGWLVMVARLEWRLISRSSLGNMVVSLALDFCYVYIMWLPINCPKLKSEYLMMFELSKIIIGICCNFRIFFWYWILRNRWEYMLGRLTDPMRAGETHWLDI